MKAFAMYFVLFSSKILWKNQHQITNNEPNYDDFSSFSTEICIHESKKQNTKGLRT